MTLSLLLDPEPPPPPSGGGMVSVPLAIALGLLASFIQSLGLTVQRKSHLIAARQPPHSRPPEWRQPLWLVGFFIFIIANIGGTIFQIGALPIVMLAPLGAVSLLYNALLAKFLLADALGSKMVGGTALILLGAVLIGYFGAIQEPPHTLDELLSLFGRPPFVALGTILFMAIFSVLIVAHLAEWQQKTPPQEKKTSGKSGKQRNRKSAYSKLTRRWSAPSLAPLDEVSETTSGVATPVLAVRDQIGQQQGQYYVTVAARPSVPQRRSYGAVEDRDASPPRRHRKSRLSLSPPRPDNGRSKLLLAVAFAAISGTLSGLCLLLAKSGVELLVQTFGLGRNQFNRFGSWALVFIMLFAAVAQLCYLNKALRLADPTLVCPLAFCFYNTSSIALGLIYFDQLSAITTPSLLCIVTGIVILLVGVFIVSMKPSAEELTGDGASDEEQGLQSLEQSTVETTELQSSPTETEALLANAGGIGGPHLPPPSALVQPSPQAAPPALPPTASPLEDPALSPLTAPPVSKTSHRRHSRSASAGTTHQMMAGLGLHLPHYIEPSPLGRKHSRRASLAASFTSPAGSSKTKSPSLSSPSLPSFSNDAAAHSAAQRQRRRTFSSDLYSSILNRGLSIGIGPSSPGFHIGPFSPVEDDEDEEEGAGVVAPLTAPPTPTGDSQLAVKGSRAASPGRRTFSDADAELVRRAREIASARGRQRKDGTPRSPLHLQTAPEEETDPATAGGEEAGSSTLYIEEGGKRLDSTVLSDRLTALRSVSRSPHATSSSSRTPLPERRGGSVSTTTNRNSTPSLPMVRGVKDWWRKNVKGSDDDMREGERRRLLE